MRWLVISLVASAALTLIVNLVLWLLPDAGRRLDRRLEQQLDDVDRRALEGRDDDHRRVRVIVPWKAMVIGSLVLTIVLNVALWLA